MRDPDAREEKAIEGGRAAERLRQFIAARFGEGAPPVPPDEEEEVSEDAPPREDGSSHARGAGEPDE